MKTNLRHTWVCTHTLTHTVMRGNHSQLSLSKEPGAFVSISRSRLVFKRNNNFKALIFFSSLSAVSFLRLVHEHTHGEHMGHTGKPSPVKSANIQSWI